VDFTKRVKKRKKKKCGKNGKKIGRDDEEYIHSVGSLKSALVWQSERNAANRRRTSFFLFFVAASVAPFGFLLHRPHDTRSDLFAICSTSFFCLCVLVLFEEILKEK
jgi:hypothetical protein